jgi:hypothetical protein
MGYSVVKKFEICQFQDDTNMILADANLSTGDQIFWSTEKSQKIWSTDYEVSINWKNTILIKWISVKRPPVSFRKCIPQGINRIARADNFLSRGYSVVKNF